MKKQKGLLIVISGPSGAGKGTICQELLKRNDKVCKFDTNLHKWVELCDYSALTTTNFTSNGLTYAQLTTSYTTKFLAYTETETLPDGSKVYEAETITPEMGVTSLDAATRNNVDYLKITVPAFTPKSIIDDETEEPKIDITVY